MWDGVAVVSAPFPSASNVLLVGVACVGMLLVACTDTASDSPTTGESTTPATSPDGGPPPPVDAAAELCGRTGTSEAGDVENPDLVEASGLVASRRHSDVFWSHNDGDDGVLFAIAADGGDLGVHELDAEDVDDIDDIEDIALISGAEGSDILLADIGDNGADRSSIHVYRFPEPDPSSPGPIGEVGEVEVLEFVYPDRPHNAETLLVDEASNRVVIVTKEQLAGDGIPDDLGETAPSHIFEGPLDAGAGSPVELRAVGTIDMADLETRSEKSPWHPARLLGAAGVPTAGDVSPDGALVALRTYETVWLWPRSAEHTVAEALLGEPCEVKAAFELLGESIAFTPDGLVTLAEGEGRPLHLVAR